MRISGVFGVVHLRAFPGDPGCEGEMFEEVLAAALVDARAVAEPGASGLIVENFGSAPFRKGDRTSRLIAHEVAFMTRVVLAVRGVFGGALGVNCLRNDAHSALGIAAATGADFIRVNVHSGAYVTDQGIIEGEAHETLRYRASLGVEVGIFADILVKHAAPLAPIAPKVAAEEVLLRGRADAVIVTGVGTGAAVDDAVLREVSEHAPGPVLIGSGLTLDNAAHLAPLAHGAIVGTASKVDAVLSNPVDVQRLGAIVELATPLFRSAPPG